jgi:hypothetical protein
VEEMEKVKEKPTKVIKKDAEKLQQKGKRYLLSCEAVKCEYNRYKML